MKKSVFTFAILLMAMIFTMQVSALQLSGFAPNQHEIVYGYVHGGYVGMADVSTDRQGGLNVYLNDAFLPHVLAAVDIDDPQWDYDNTISYISHGEEEFASLFVEYDGTTYVAEPLGEGFAYVEADDMGYPIGNTDLEKIILRNQVTMATYFELIDKGGFLLKTGFDSPGIPVTETDYGGLTKKFAPKYFDHSLTWIGNIEALEEFIEENGTGFSLSDMVRAKEANAEGSKLWSVVDEVTGASLSDFKDYYGLVQNAVGRFSSIRGFAPNQSETAYMYTHGGYVGKAEVTVDGSGKLDVYIDDAFLPHVLSAVEIDDPQWNYDNTISFISHGEEEFASLFVEYDGTIYVAEPLGEGFAYVEADEMGFPVGNKDLELIIIRNQVTMAAYFENLAAGKLKIKTGYEDPGTPITSTSYGGVTKKFAPKYFDHSLTWIGNIEAMEAFIEEHGTAYSLSDMVRAKEANAEGSKLWSVVDEVTGASLSDFKDYFALVQNAVGRFTLNK